jgi:3-dehydroquinate synthetase
LFYCRLTKVGGRIRLAAEVLLPVLLRAAGLKAHITSIDATELGVRCVLNWGHTIGTCSVADRCAVLLRFCDVLATV